MDEWSVNITQTSAKSKSLRGILWTHHRYSANEHPHGKGLPSVSCEVCTMPACALLRSVDSQQEIKKKRGCFIISPLIPHLALVLNCVCVCVCVRTLCLCVQVRAEAHVSRINDHTLHVFLAGLSSFPPCAFWHKSMFVLWDCTQGLKCTDV